MSYAERKGIALSEAVRWATEMAFDVTLYIYDEDGNKPVKLSDLPADDPLRIEWERLEQTRSLIHHSCISRPIQRWFAPTRRWL